jgi:NadR type nicotinamide-nucleotide adenylyltransferase
LSDSIIRVALIGPESTGKSSVCALLAGYFHTAWVPEFARSYLETLGHRYTEEDVLYCAKKQIESEKLLLNVANKILFSDTEMINFRVWLMDVYGNCPQWIENEITQNKYDFYLLMKPDIPFENDLVRENPQRRDYFFTLYKSELEKRNFHYAIVDGTGEERFKSAVKAVEKILFS